MAKPLRPKSNELRRISMGFPSRNTQKILIISEGYVEESYFKQINSFFKRKPIELIPMYSSGEPDALSVVEFAIKQKKKYSKDDDLKSVWCVFDVDENWINKKIEPALQKAYKNKINICISNPCFEIWLLLHQDFWSAAHIENGDAAKNLLQKYIKNYDSSKSFFQENLKIFEDLINKKDIAILKAEKLDKLYDKEFPERYEKEKYLIEYNIERNPATHVYKLIKEIFEILEKETK